MLNIAVTCFTFERMFLMKALPGLRGMPLGKWQQQMQINHMGPQARCLLLLLHKEKLEGFMQQ